MNNVHPQLETIFTWLPERCPSIFIAGGAAADYDKASDVDIWFPAAAADEALRFINRFTVNALTKADEQLNNDIGAVVTPDYVGSNSKSVVIGVVWHPSVAKPIQIMLNTTESSYKLMNTFDLSCHAIAIHSDGKVVLGKYYTPLDKPIRVRSGSSLSLSRYIKMCSRYNQEINFSQLDDTFLLHLNHYGLDKYLHDTKPAEP